MNYLFDYLLSLPYLTETCSLVMAFSLSALLCLDLDRLKTVIPGMERHLSLEHKWHQTVKEPLRLVTLFFSPANDQYMVLSYDVTSAMVVSQNNEMSRGHETFFLCKNVSFVPININLHGYWPHD